MKPSIQCEMMIDRYPVRRCKHMATGFLRGATSNNRHLRKYVCTRHGNNFDEDKRDLDFEAISIKAGAP